MTTPDQVSSDTKPIYVSEVARRLGVGPETARKWTVRGLIPYTTTLGGRRRYDPAVIDAIAAGSWTNQPTPSIVAAAEPAIPGQADILEAL
jgi:excisionase family DNA binding protein